MLRSLLRLTALLPLAAALGGCKDFFGNKTELDFITPPVADTTNVSYVPVLPFISEGLRHPIAVIAGNDNLLYVADDVLQHLVCFDESGRELSRMYVPNIRGIAQDRTLDILAVGAEALPEDSDTTRVLATIYRIAVKNGSYGLGADKIVKKIQQPLGLRPAPNPSDYGVRYNGIAVLPDNRYYVTRSGAGDDVTTRSPNDAVLLFDRNDRLQTPIQISDAAGGQFADYFKRPYSISAVPPKAVTINGTDVSDFLVTTLDSADESVLRVRYISVNESENGISYTLKPLATAPSETNPGALYEPNRFAWPGGVGFADDETNYIFVTDRDMFYQFNPEGIEGVRLIAQSTSRFNKVSFGGTGSGLYQFRDPRGIGYMNRIVYIADAGNGRVVRYKLSTDFE